MAPDQELGSAGVGLLSPCTSPFLGVNEDILFDSVVSSDNPFLQPTSKSRLHTAPLFLHMAFRTVTEAKLEQSAFRKSVDEKLEQSTIHPYHSDQCVPLCLS